MPETYYNKTIRCPSCRYEGKAKIIGSNNMLWLLFLGLLFISFLFLPLFAVAGILFFWLISNPKKLVCPRCKYPIPQPA